LYEKVELAVYNAAVGNVGVLEKLYEHGCELFDCRVCRKLNLN
jgi:hypothetical protein